METSEVRREWRVGRREVGSKVGVWRPSEEKESGVRFRIAMRWVRRDGRFDAKGGIAVDKGVRGDNGEVEGERIESWDEKLGKSFGEGKDE